MDEIRVALEQVESVERPMVNLISTLQESAGNTEELRQLRADVNNIASSLAAIRAKLYQMLASTAQLEAMSRRKKADNWATQGKKRDAEDR